MTGDAFSEFDPIVRARDLSSSPWSEDVFVPDLDLLRELLSIPVSAGSTQETGRVAKAFDAWIAHELRRAGFPQNGVWPRMRRPRVLPDDLADLEFRLEALEAELALAEADGRLKPASLRRAIRALEDKLPGAADAYVLGDFYSKQIDVLVSTWRRGPDLLVSTKTMFSSYRKNLRNRHEEAVGEVMSLRARHPMAAMGYAYLVRTSIYEEEGAYAVLYDILDRLRRPGDAFDATLLLVAEWDAADQPPAVTDIVTPAEELGARRFFADMIDLVCARSPVSEHTEVRARRRPEPPGGLPDEDEEENATPS